MRRASTSSSTPQAQNRPASVMSMTISVEVRNRSRRREAEAAINVAGKCLQKAVDDAGVHGRAPSIAFQEMTAAVRPRLLATGVVERGRADLAAAEQFAGCRLLAL